MAAMRAVRIVETLNGMHGSYRIVIARTYGKMVHRAGIESCPSLSYNKKEEQ